MKLDYSTLMCMFSILYLLVSIVFFLIKKKDKKGVLLTYLAMLPNLINQAEKLFSNGADKLNYVLSIIYAQLKKDEVKDIDVINFDFKSAIENILSTPQKKESGIDEAKKDD